MPTCGFGLAYDGSGRCLGPHVAMTPATWVGDTAELCRQSATTSRFLSRLRMVKSPRLCCASLLTQGFSEMLAAAASSSAIAWASSLDTRSIVAV